MAEEIFFSKFLDALRESANDLGPQRELAPWARNLYLKKWNYCDSSRDPGVAIVASDGSIGESSFSGGLTVWVARAIAHIYRNDLSIANLQEVAVKIGYRLLGQSLFMKALEIKVLREATEKALREHGGALSIFDGSLYLTFLHHPPRLRAIEWIFGKYLNELTSLLNLTKSGAIVLGLSKDSDISYLRARILLDALLEVDPSLGSELSKGRVVSRMAERLKLKLENWKNNVLLRNYLDELELETSDESVYGEVAEGPGFTTPLLLAPQTLFTTEEIDGGTESWWDSAFRKRLEGNARSSSLARALDRYFDLPPLALSYWKPRHESRAYRIDIPSNLLGFEGRCGDISEDKFFEEGLGKVADLVASLNSISQYPYVAKPLAEVDEIARLDRSLYKLAYEPVIVEELRKRGFKAIPKKRSVRDLVLRRY